MVAWSNTIRKFATLSVSGIAGVGFATLFNDYLTERKTIAHASWTNSEKSLSCQCALWDRNWDFRDPKSIVRPLKNDTVQEQNRFNADFEKATTTSTRHIILIRHGEYLDDGEADATHHLTVRGQKQAKYTGKRLHELSIKWNQVIVSTMTRAQETANIILKEIDFDPKDVKHCPLLREGAPIPPQPPVGHWKPETAQFFRDGARIEAGFRRYFHRSLPTDSEDTYTLIVGHGNVIRYFVCRALQFAPEAWLRMSIDHSSITWLVIRPNGNVSIRYLGDSGFMPPNLLTNRIPRDAGNVV